MSEEWNEGPGSRQKMTGRQQVYSGPRALVLSAVISRLPDPALSRISMPLFLSVDSVYHANMTDKINMVSLWEGRGSQRLHGSAAAVYG